MNLQSLLFSLFALMTATLSAGVKDTPDWDNPAGWFLQDAKILEENGEKFVRISPCDGSQPARINHYINPTGIKQLKVTVTYRTSVANSVPNYGAWYYFGFAGTNKMEALVLTPSSNWKTVDKTFAVPADAKQINAELRLQGMKAKILDVKDITIEQID